MAIPDTLERWAMLVVKNDVLTIIRFTITWNDDRYLFDSGIRSIIMMSITPGIKMEGYLALLFYWKVVGYLKSLLVHGHSWMGMIEHILEG